ncbi:MAG: quinone oxidoreductase [Bryobacterales bacterium]|nr:quinone oxidoreductase [Bryobacterales bacterium]
MKAVVATGPGGLEVLRTVTMPDPAPAAGEAVVRLSAIGVNFIDIYFRTGLYKAPAPVLLGHEGAGTVEAVGKGVTTVKPGDRVAYAGIRGSYAELHSVPASQLVPLPDSVRFEQGAAVMLQGMTAHYLTYSTYPLKPGDTALVHAAAGGVGLLLIQIAKKRGAIVIGTTSTEEKAKLAMEAGADHVILYDRTDFQAETRRLTGGRGVNVVYDSVGKATFAKSLDSLATLGMMVSYGNASGPAPAIEPLTLSQKGSLFLTRPVMGHYVATRESLLWRAGDVLGWVADGSLKLHISHEFPLEEAGKAQQLLGSRGSTGKLLLKTGAIQ